MEGPTKVRVDAELNLTCIYTTVYEDDVILKIDSVDWGLVDRSWDGDGFE